TGAGFVGRYAKACRERMRLCCSEDHAGKQCSRGGCDDRSRGGIPTACHIKLGSVRGNHAMIDGLTRRPHSLKAIGVQGVVPGLLPRLNAMADIDARGRSIKTETKIVVRVNDQLPFRKHRSVQRCEPDTETSLPGSLFNLPSEPGRRSDRTLRVTP